MVGIRWQIDRPLRVNGDICNFEIIIFVVTGALLPEKGPIPFGCVIHIKYRIIPFDFRTRNLPFRLAAATEVYNFSRERSVAEK